MSAFSSETAEQGVAPLIGEQLTARHGELYADGRYGAHRGGYAHHSRVLRQTLAQLHVASS